ncbi:MFS transporter [Calothrix sp. PCC 7507]|uniref:MFS transporter n=1 Tax=Calothrix sp. PCC 7507 TaxID=99598 RepID=UPI00029EE429|nr:MFS transporter [Calothrix sp. PCC 7507]AFY34032.1 major facilitator superfamily MFS_1 [Calothrix sp. PCC 7507]
MKAFDSFDAHLRRNLLTLFTAGLLFWSSMAALLPTLPLYLEDVGGSTQQIGIVMGGFAIGLLMFRPMLGRLADQRGRKILLLIGVIIAAIAPFGYLAFKSMAMLTVVRAFHGVSVAAFTTGYSALVADLAPVESRGEIIGYMSLTAPIGLAIGPALGGYLQAAVGYPLLFLVAAELAFVALLATLQIVNPPLQKPRETESSNSKFWHLLISHRVRVPTVVMLLVGLGLGTVHTFVGLFIKSTGVDLNVGLFFTGAAVASFSVRLFAGKASDRLGRGLFITCSIVAYTVSLLILWQANSAIAFLIAACLEGCGGGTLISMVITMMADRSFPQERGQVFAICVAGFDLGIAIAAPVFGSLAEQIGYRNMFGFSAILTFLAFLIFLTQSSKNLSNSLRFALGRSEDVYSLNKL